MTAVVRRWRGESVWATHVAVWEDEGHTGHVLLSVDEGAQERTLHLAPDTAREMAAALIDAADAAEAGDPS